MGSKVFSLIVIPLMIAGIGLLGRFFVIIIGKHKAGKNFQVAKREALDEGIVVSPELCLLAIGADVALKYHYLKTPALTDVFLFVLFLHVALWLFCLILTVIPTDTKVRIHLNNGLGFFALGSVITPLFFLA